MIGPPVLASQWRVWRRRRRIDATGETPTVNQIEWTPFGRSDEMMRYAQAYSPLTRGTRLDDEKYDKSPAQLLIRWNLQSGTVPLPKANQPDHLEDDIDVFDFEIGKQDLAVFNRLNGHYSALGTLPCA